MQTCRSWTELSKTGPNQQTPEGLRIQLVDQERPPDVRSGLGPSPTTAPDPVCAPWPKIAARTAQPRLPSGPATPGANSDGSKSAGDWPLSAGARCASRQIKAGTARHRPRPNLSGVGKAASDPRSRTIRTLARQPPHHHLLLRDIAGPAAETLTLKAGCGERRPLREGAAFVPNHRL